MGIRTTLTYVTLTSAAASVLLAPVARADVDTDFANQLHTYGIYGPKDYNAWIGKIACKRITTHLDATAYESAAFLKDNLARTNSTTQTWQFLGAAISAYCPEQTSTLQSSSPPVVSAPGE
jgi:hypothetical protein